MPETLPSKPPSLQKPPMWDRIVRICGLDRKTPIGAMENVRESFGLVKAVRGGFKSLLSQNYTRRIAY